MAITIRPDGSIVASTPQEAVEVQRLIMDQQSARTNPVKPRAAVNSEPQRIIDKLRQHDGQEIDAARLSRALSMESTKGVGTKMRHLDKAFRAAGMDLSEILPSHEGADGLKRWTVHISKANGSA